MNIREIELSISSYVNEKGHKPYWIKINAMELEELRRQAEEELGLPEAGGLPNYFLGMKVILDLNVKGWIIGP